MTTPEETKGEASAPRKRPKMSGYEAKPEPPRQGPDRSGGAQSKPRSVDPDKSINEEIAQVVKIAYDVIAENIQQVRQAAEQFRQGEYHISEVPGDLEDIAARLLHVAREFSDATFDICERLLCEMRGVLRAAEQDDHLRGFRGPASAGKPPAPKTEELKLNVCFLGTVKATARNKPLQRPKQPTTPDQITASPLMSRESDAKPISGVRFEIDISREGLTAVVPLPADQPAGTYSGLVYAASEDIPLGVLTIEIGK